MSEIKIEEIIIPNKIQTFEDKRTKSKTVTFPFNFPDGTKGIVMITRLSPEKWNPSDDIETCQLVFKEDAKIFES